MNLRRNKIFLKYTIGRLAACLIVLLSVLPAFPSEKIYWKQTGTRSDSLLLRLEREVRANRTPTRPEIESLYGLAKQSGLAADRWRALYWDALSLRPTAPEKADSLLAIASKCVKKEWSYDYYRICTYKRHLDNQRSGKIYDDYLLLKETADFYQSVGDMFNLADTYNKIGVIFSQLKESQLALENFRKAEKLYVEHGYGEQASRIRLNIANSYFDMGERKKALDLLLSIEKDMPADKDVDFHLSVLFSLTRSLIDNKDMEAYGRYMEVLQSLQPDNPRLVYKKNTHLAFYNYLHRNFGTSIALYKDALEASLRDHDMTAANCLLGLIYNYQEMERWDSTTYYWERLYAYSDSVERIAKVNNMKRMESLATIKNYEQRLADEKEKAELRQNIILISALFVVSLLVSLIFIIRGIQQKDKVLKQLKESENRELHVKLENERLQNRQRQLDIEEQNRKLIMNTLLLSEKITALKNIQNHIKEAALKEELSSRTATIIDTYIKSHIQESQNWLSFKATFEKTDPQFYDRLREKCPDLSEYEQRLCAFIHLRMDNKTIANMLNVQPDSVKKSRQRLRKKLNLPPEISIEDFLHTVS